MKKWMLLVFFIVTTGLFAQQQTLLSGNMSHGGFGGPVVKFGNFIDDFGVFVGGRGGWIINHQFVLGGGGYGLANEIPSKNSNNLYYNFGYGGVEIEYIAASDRLIHLTFQTLIGGGGISLQDKNYIFDDNNHDSETVESDGFFVAEPGVNLMLNVTSFFRIGFGTHYRFISDLDMTDLAASDVSGPAAAITLKFGSF